MGNSNVKKDFDEYGCDDEEFRRWLLSKYIDEPDYNNYKIMLKDIIEREIRLIAIAKKYGGKITNGEVGSVSFRLAIKKEFKETVKWYKNFKKGFTPYPELRIKDRFIQRFKNIRLN